MIFRQQLQFAQDRIFKGKALIIYGPRQVGKTTFTKLLLEKNDQPKLELNGDDADVRELFSSPNVSQLTNLIGQNKILVIDEAQRIPNIGLAIKIIVDRIEGVQVIATGSSSFELASHINEPLTGRKYEMLLLPFSHGELVAHSNMLEEKRQLEQRLIFGSYPEIVTDANAAREHLQLIANSYLYKDLFTLDQIKRPNLFEKLVKALALQVGSEVNANELSQLIGADNKTIEKYLYLLEQSFVIFTLPSFSRNVRNELKKSRKIYFFDNGVISAITGNFNPLVNRSDVGALWENYLISERYKAQNIQRNQYQQYFWRTTSQQEIDYVEETSDGIQAYEFKWKPTAKKSFPLTFTKAYPKATTKVITLENFGWFLG